MPISTPSSGTSDLPLQADDVAHTLTAFGWSESGTGAVAWHVAADGSMGIGTSTLDAGCWLTVNGAGNIALHTEQVQLTSPSSTPPTLVGATELGLQTSGGGSSIYLRTGSETTEYTAVSGTAASRGGHRFRTGSSPATRFCIADDAVALDVPLMLQSCSNSSLPAASSHPGCLIAIPDRGPAIQLAFSNGANWVVLSSEDLI